MESNVVYFTYARKSSEDKERQVLSISSQIDWSQDVKENRKIKISSVFSEEKSAETPYKRVTFDEMTRRIRSGEANGIVTWKLDRLARNPEEAGVILGMLKRGEIQHIITNEREYRPGDNAIISYVDFGMADQYVRDLSRNVKRGLRTKVDMGWYPTRAPLGYLNTRDPQNKGRNEILKDPERFAQVKQMW